MDWIVRPIAQGLRGVVRVPSDKSIGHRAVILGALADGTSTLRRFSFGEDNVSTLKAFEAMGVAHEILEQGSVKQPIDGRPLDCGNSGTTMRLLAGLLCAQEFGSTLVGDESLMRRPMRRVLEPLRRRGAHCRGQKHPTKDDETAPIRIAPLVEGEALTGIEVALEIASAQVKSALLLSGLYAHGPTVVQEPTLSRDHTERMFEGAGVPLRRVGSVVQLDPAGWDGRIAPFDITIPGDPSAASFLVVAANVIPGSVLRVVDVGVNPTRTGAFDVLRAMNAGAELVSKGDVSGEPIAHLETSAAVDESGAGMRATMIGGELVPRAIDEIPVLCVAAARASGTTVVRDAAELRVKESDRIATMAEVLRAFGVDARELPDGLEIVGKPTGPLRAATVASKGDHRIAMSAALLALRGDGPSIIRDVDCVATSFPGFARTLADLGASIDEVEEVDEAGHG
ncbi:MAG: 3-phosphoshikimate 1-carboxyvinyltransferase [Deltaproteobacteria bacterium]|nr:3-phosphoshikimate 1-carboxyvinyltransferase [Deltaproteobacteria bacterium]